MAETRQYERLSREELAALLIAAQTSDRKPDDRTFRGLDRFEEWLAHRVRERGPYFTATAFEIGKGLAKGSGYELTEHDRQLYLAGRHPGWYQNVKSRLALAKRLGRINYGVVRGNGVGGNKCYWIRVLAPPIPSVPRVSITAGPGRYHQPHRRRGCRPTPPPREIFLRRGNLINRSTAAASATPQRQRGGRMDTTRAARAPARAPAHEAAPANDCNEERRPELAVLSGGLSTLETLKAELKDGYPPTERLCQAFMLLLGRPARFSFRRWAARLERACERGDRFGDQGAGGKGLAALRLIELIEDQAAVEAAYADAIAFSCRDCDNTGWMSTVHADGYEYAKPCRCRDRRRVPKPPQVASLAWFVPLIETETRRWRRNVRLREAAELGIEVAPGQPVRARLREVRRANRRADHDGEGE